MKNKVALVFRLNAMGDILLTIPTLKGLVQAGWQVHLVINKKWASLATFLPATVHFYEGTEGLLPLVKQLKKLNAAKVFDLQGKLSTVIMRSLLQAPTTKKYSKRTFTEQLQVIKGHYPIVLKDQTPIWKKYARVCEVTPSASPLLCLSPSYIQECKKLLPKLGLRENNFVFIHPDASKPGKTIPEKLLTELVSKLKLPVAIIGTSTYELNKTNGLEKALDCRNKISLYHLPGVISLAKVLITSDSGPMHLARAVNTPLLALFFQTDLSLGFEPIPSNKTRVISKQLPCKPCSLHGQNKKCPLGHFNCKNIEAIEVLKELETLLG